MVGKRKADDNLTGTRHPAARRDPRAGEDLAGTSANNTGPTANAAGDGIAEISPAMAWLLEVTSGYARGSPQFDGAARGAGGGSGYRGLSQSHGRAPQMPSQGMLRPPQIPSQGMLRPPLGNPAGGRPPFTNQYHAPTGNGSLSGQSQNHAAGHRQRGTGQPRGHSGSDGTSSTISCASAPGARVPVSPLARDGYNNFVTSNMFPQHPEIRYVPPRPVPSYGGATQGQGIAIGHQPQLEPRLRQPSSAAPAGVAVGPRTWGPSAQWCRLCPAPATRVYCSAPFCEVCYSRLFAADDVPQQHAQAGGYAPRGAVPASEQQYRAAAIRPSSSSSSSSSVGSGPICQACGHLVRTRNRMCRSCHRGGPPPPGLG